MSCHGNGNVNGNHFEQYGRKKNLEITGIPGDVRDENLSEKVIKVLIEISSSSQALIGGHP